MLTSSIQDYERLRAGPDDFVIPAPLQQADYSELYSYFAYELPFVTTWGATQARNDYFMNKQKNLPADEILQYEAE